jgi:hypothetical protein
VVPHLHCASHANIPILHLWAKFGEEGGLFEDFGAKMWPIKYFKVTTIMSIHATKAKIPASVSPRAPRKV